MSDASLKRVKQIRKKTGSDTYLSLPIGSQGLLVDMVSQLDLEEEIRLGGNHYTTITSTDLATTIKEWYFSQPRGTRTITQMASYVTYTVVVAFISSVEVYITQEETEADNGYRIITQGPQPLDFLISLQSVDSGQQRIDISLYKGDEQTLLHHKVVYIHESPMGDIAIDEQVDNSGQVNNLLEVNEG